MAHCPKCGRNSLEYSERRSEAWCLYSECGFSTQVKDYADYSVHFERGQIHISIPPTTKKKRHLTAR